MMSSQLNEPENISRKKKKIKFSRSILILLSFVVLINLYFSGWDFAKFFKICFAEIIIVSIGYLIIQNPGHVNRKKERLSKFKQVQEDEDNFRFDWELNSSRYSNNLSQTNNYISQLGSDNGLSPENQNVTKSHVPFKVETISDGEKRIPLKAEAISSTEKNIPLKVETISNREKSTPYKVETISNRVENIPYKVETISNRVENIPFKVETISNKVGTISNKVGTISNKIESTPYKVETISNKVENIPSKVGTISNKVETIPFKVETISNNVASNTSKNLNSNKILDNKPKKFQGTMQSLSQPSSPSNWNTDGSKFQGKAPYRSPLDPIHPQIDLKNTKMPEINDTVEYIETSELSVFDAFVEAKIKYKEFCEGQNYHNDTSHQEVFNYHHCVTQPEVENSDGSTSSKKGTEYNISSILQKVENSDESTSSKNGTEYNISSILQKVENSDESTSSKNGTEYNVSSILQKVENSDESTSSKKGTEYNVSSILHNVEDFDGSTNQEHQNFNNLATHQEGENYHNCTTNMEVNDYDKSWETKNDVFSNVVDLYNYTKSFQPNFDNNNSLSVDETICKEPEPENNAQIEIIKKNSSFLTVCPPVETPTFSSVTSNLAQHRNYVLPSVEFLHKNLHLMDNTENMFDDETELTAAKLIETLESFGVGTKIVNISKGPSITRYELQPDKGVKVSKVVSLSDDIALNLAATTVRIEAPIPGKAAIGIEIPNRDITSVLLRDVIETQEFMDHPSKLAFAVGRDTTGNTIVADIARMPHLLIAGATGSGKSVCINTLITSILYKASPGEVKLIMIDPKVVELSIYNGIPHLLVPVVTDPKKAAGVLNWAVTEMNNRYKLFAENSVRDIKGYNKVILQNGDENILPQIVIIIDELADLMMIAAKEVEDYICRLAQMARAAGMHLVIATQRPSVDVITGIIKANIPSRISFAVSSQVDSRTILDMAGAEKLLGRGDMLFSPIGIQKPVRVQGSFISDDEVDAIVKQLKSNGSAVYSDDIMTKIENSYESIPIENSDDDELLPTAIDITLESGQASASFIQRKLKVGYSRAARIMDQMEAWGIISPSDGSKPRRILISKHEWNELNS